MPGLCKAVLALSIPSAPVEPYSLNPYAGGLVSGRRAIKLHALALPLLNAAAFPNHHVQTLAACSSTTAKTVILSQLSNPLALLDTDMYLPLKCRVGRPLKDVALKVGLAVAELFRAIAWLLLPDLSFQNPTSPLSAGCELPAA